MPATHNSSRQGKDTEDMRTVARRRGTTVGAGCRATKRTGVDTNSGGGWCLLSGRVTGTSMGMGMDMDTGLRVVEMRVVCTIMTDLEVMAWLCVGLGRWLMTASIFCSYLLLFGLAVVDGRGSDAARRKLVRLETYLVQGDDKPSDMMHRGAFCNIHPDGQEGPNVSYIRPSSSFECLLVVSISTSFTAPSVTTLSRATS